jgi:hypothetical protein
VLPDDRRRFEDHGPLAADYGWSTASESRNVSGVSFSVMKAPPGSA